MNLDIAKGFRFCGGRIVGLRSGTKSNDEWRSLNQSGNFGVV